MSETQILAPELGYAATDTHSCRDHAYMHTTVCSTHYPSRRQLGGWGNAGV